MSEQLPPPIDLHLHTNYSDGELAPQELLALASEKGVAAISITDHDTVSAYTEEPLAEVANSYGVELVPGVEISAQEPAGPRSHILGLYINPSHLGLQKWLKCQRDNRDAYAYAVTERLGEQGWVAKLPELPSGQSLTKAHIARSVVEHPENRAKLFSLFGRTPSSGAFIEQVMNEGKPCFVSRITPTPQDAINIIHSAGGLAFMAHPIASIYEQGVSVDAITVALQKYDFDGVEAFYYYYHRSGIDQEINEIDLFLNIAHRLGLLVCGGSDFHTAQGKYTDIGFGGKTSVPRLNLLQDLQYRLGLADKTHF